MMKRIICTIAIVFALAATTVAEAKTYAVCVGLSDYEGTINDLRVSANDAVTMSNIFASNGNCRVATLTNKKATAKRVCELMEQTFRAAGANDVIILFFSGHGYPGGICCYESNLPYENVLKVMQKSKAKSKVIFADCCYAGKMRDDKREPLNGKDVLLFLSSRSGETSLEMNVGNNSAFTYYLAKALIGKADSSRDRIVTAKELYNYVHKNVIHYAESKKHDQHPVMWGRFDDNMPIIKWSKKSKNYKN